MYANFSRLLLIFLILIISGCQESYLPSVSSSNEIIFKRWKFEQPQFGYEIWTMDPNGENQQILLKDNQHVGREVLWSPDGKKIINLYGNILMFPKMSISEIKKREFSEVEIIDLVNKNRISLLKRKGFISNISWFPTNKEIMFKWSIERKDRNIYSFNIAQQKLQKLIEAEKVHEPALSPDGEQIIFESFEKIGVPKIYIMSVKEKKSKRLTDSPPEVKEMLPVWSPDGEWIAFAELTPQSQKLYHPIVLINLKTNQRKEIPLPKTSISLIDKMNFSPDGKKIIWSTPPLTGMSAEIYTIDIDGKNLKNLTNTPDWDESCPSWRPIAKK